MTHNVRFSINNLEIFTLSTYIGKPGFHLGLDNHTCISDQQGAIRNQEDVVSSSHNGSNMLGSCNMGCSSIISMKQQVSELNEIVRSLNTAIKLYRLG